MKQARVNTRVNHALHIKDPARFDQLFQRTNDKISIRVVNYRTRSYSNAIENRALGTQSRGKQEVLQKTEPKQLTFYKSQYNYPFIIKQTPCSNKLNQIVETTRSRLFVHRVMGLKHGKTNIKSTTANPNRISLEEINLTKNLAAFSRSETPLQTQMKVLSVQQIKDVYRCVIPVEIANLQEKDQYLGFMDDFQTLVSHVQQSLDALNRKNSQFKRDLEAFRNDFDETRESLHKIVNSIEADIGFRVKTSSIKNMLKSAVNLQCEFKLAKLSQCKQIQDELSGVQNEIERSLSGLKELQEVLFGEGIFELQAVDKGLELGGVQAISSSQQFFILKDNIF